MKILIVGNKGSMGRRYTAILNKFGIDVIGLDMEGSERPLESIPFDRAIICTPTDNHFYYAKHLIPLGKPVLIEKPVSKNITEISHMEMLAKRHGTDVRMVCNYAFALSHKKLFKPELNRVEYDYYHTGNDGLLWDCIQLVYLADKAAHFISASSPTFKCTIKRKHKSSSDKSAVTLDDIGLSYIRMIDSWINDKNELWTLEDALKATRKVLDLCSTL